MSSLVSIRMGVCLPAALLLANCVNSGPVPGDKPETWIEVTTPHFNVMSNDGEKSARRIADQFERIRLLYSKALSTGLKLDPGIPIFIIAARNEKSLSEILPEFWTEKGHTHPAGIFVAGPEKNYIALRSDAEGEFPYLTVYHEYVHMIVNLNLQHCPTWANEGFATFLGTATVTSSQGKLGQPNSSELYLLSQSKLLPLEVLFRVDNRSPYYNEAAKTNIFYAESWALVHYLMLDPARKKDNSLGKYFNLMELGGDPVEAAKAAFGDLGQLQKDLQSYISRIVYLEYSVPLQGLTNPASYSARPLPPAESEARLGDFDIYRGHLDLAKPKLEDAIRLDPDLPAPQESMGLLLYRQQNTAEAQKYLARAVALDSKSAIANYYDGMLLLRNGADEKEAAEAQSALEKAVALNPQFAPAWETLGMLYAHDAQKLELALTSVAKAIKAVPGEPRYRLSFAYILMRMGKFDDARRVAQNVVSSGNSFVASQADQLLTQIDQAKTYSAQRQANQNTHATPEAASDFDGSQSSSQTGTGTPPVMKRRSNRTDNAPPDPEPGRPGEAADSAASSKPSPVYSMLGTIGNVNCGDGKEIQVTLQFGSIAMKLHAEDISQLTSTPTSDFCSRLNGKKAHIVYFLVTGKSWDGEIASIEMQ
jgi:tetratricopeptide (TPR) repeat protein